MISLRTRNSEQRQGSTLLLVLVVVMLLSFSCYSFVELMLVEYEATKVASTQQQLKRVADSGIEATAAWLEARNFHGESRDFPKSGLVAESDQERLEFAIQPSLTLDRLTHANSPFINESSKLNLNSLPLEPHKRKVARQRLLMLPEMSEEVADAILDWMDKDDEPSQYGAESSYYFNLSPSYTPRQERLRSLNELLHVRGVTKEKLFGNDGTGGWSRYLTLHSAESNLAQGGLPKINVNSPDLDTLFSQLESLFDPDAAKFVVSWRLAGSAHGAESQRTAEFDEDDREEAKRMVRVETGRARLKTQLRSRSRRNSSGSGVLRKGDVDDNSKMRGGIDVSRRPAYTIRSIFDLIGTKVRIDVNRQDTVLESPWQADSAELLELALTLDQQLTVTPKRRLAGRININLAPATVLATIPGVSHSLAESIVLNRRQASRRSDNNQLNSVAWLITEKLIDMDQLRQIAPYITTGGDVIRGVSVGKISTHEAGFAVGFLIDGTGERAMVREISDLGLLPLEPLRMEAIQ